MDEAIEAREGMKIREIFSRKGEAYFRKAEKEALQGLLQRDAQVIATGGGAVLDAENLRLMEEKSLLVCLTASAETLIERVGKGNQRPLLRGRDKRKRLQELLKQRERAYAQAHVRIDTDGLSVEEVVGKILEAIKGVED
jgi:shikimate kinase